MVERRTDWGLYAIDCENDGIAATAFLLRSIKAASKGRSLATAAEFDQ
jgi:hypothetical protein